MTDSRISKKRDTDAMCSTLAWIQYNDAPKMKINRDLFLENLKTAGYISMANTFLYVLEIMKSAIAEGYTPDEILGHFQVDLKESWDILASSKIGSGAFKEMDIDDILNVETPAQLLRKSSILCRR